MTSQLQQKPSEATATQLQFDGDPADWPWMLPSVAVKLRQLRRERDDARVVRRSTSDELRDVRDAKRTAEARLKELLGSRRDSPFFIPHARPELTVDDDHPEVVAARRRLETAEAEIKRLEPVLAERDHPLEQLNRLVDSIHRYCCERLRPRGAVTLFDGARPPRQKRDPIEAVERCRQRINELDAERRRVSSAPWHAEQARQRLRSEIERLAARGKPDIRPLIHSPDRTIGWQGTPIHDMVVAGRVVTMEGEPAALPLLLWLHKDAIVAKLEAAIDETADDDHALTVEDRTQQLIRIECDKLKVEREEEFFIEQANRGGAHVLRRPDADPRAVLALSDEMPPPL